MEIENTQDNPLDGRNHLDRGDYFIGGSHKKRSSPDSDLKEIAELEALITDHLKEGHPRAEIEAQILKEHIGAKKKNITKAFSNAKKIVSLEKKAMKGGNLHRLVGSGTVPSTGLSQFRGGSQSGYHTPTNQPILTAAQRAAAALRLAEEIEAANKRTTPTKPPSSPKTSDTTTNPGTTGKGRVRLTKAAFLKRMAEGKRRQGAGVCASKKSVAAVEPEPAPPRHPRQPVRPPVQPHRVVHPQPDIAAELVAAQNAAHRRAMADRGPLAQIGHRALKKLYSGKGCVQSRRTGRMTEAQYQAWLLSPEVNRHIVAAQQAAHAEAAAEEIRRLERRAAVEAQNNPSAYLPPHSRSSTTDPGDVGDGRYRGKGCVQSRPPVATNTTMLEFVDSLPPADRERFKRDVETLAIRQGERTSMANKIAHEKELEDMTVEERKELAREAKANPFNWFKGKGHCMSRNIVVEQPVEDEIPWARRAPHDREAELAAQVAADAAAESESDEDQREERETEARITEAERYGRTGKIVHIRAPERAREIPYEGLDRTIDSMVASRQRRIREAIDIANIAFAQKWLAEHPGQPIPSEIVQRYPLPPIVNGHGNCISRRSSVGQPVRVAPPGAAYDDDEEVVYNNAIAAANSAYAAARAAEDANESSSDEEQSNERVTQEALDMAKRWGETGLDTRIRAPEQVRDIPYEGIHKTPDSVEASRNRRVAETVDAANRLVAQRWAENNPGHPLPENARMDERNMFVPRVGRGATPSMGLSKYRGGRTPVSLPRADARAMEEEAERSNPIIDYAHFDADHRGYHGSGTGAIDEWTLSKSRSPLRGEPSAGEMGYQLAKHMVSTRGAGFSREFMKGLHGGVGAQRGFVPPPPPKVESLGDKIKNEFVNPDSALRSKWLPVVDTVARAAQLPLNLLGAEFGDPLLGTQISSGVSSVAKANRLASAAQRTAKEVKNYKGISSLANIAKIASSAAPDVASIKFGSLKTRAARKPPTYSEGRAAEVERLSKLYKVGRYKARGGKKMKLADDGFEGEMIAVAGGKKRRATGGANDGRRKRAEIVKRVMKEKGMKMIDASKYVKQHNLY